MTSFTLHHWLLIFLILIPMTEQTETSLTAKFHQRATLTCNQKCSGVVKWKMFNKPDVLARCDPLSCQSEDEYEISHDQYLKGNLDLIIRSVDFSKRTIFTCYCDDKPVCDVRLIIEFLVSQIHKKSGEALVLDLHISEPMEVVYKSKDKTVSNEELVCLVIYNSLRCEDNYKQKASLNHTELTLRNMNVSDSGVYIIRDMKRKEVIHTYLVSIEESQRLLPEESSPLIPAISVTGLLVILLMIMAVICLRSNMQKKNEIENLQKENESLRGSLHEAEREMEQKQAKLDSVLKVMRRSSMMDRFIHRYREGRGSMSSTNSKNTTEMEIMTEDKVEEFKLNKDSPDMKKSNKLCSRKDSKLNKIPLECRADIHVEEEVDEEVESSDARKPKSWSEDQKTAKPEELMELNPNGPVIKQNQMSSHSLTEEKEADQ